MTVGEASWAVHCDFDGTIVRDDVTDLLLERFADPAWRAFEDAWQRDEIGSRDCMAAQVRLLDVTRAELDAWLATIDIDPSFARFVAVTRHAGIALTVVSDGIDYVIRSILDRHGFAALAVCANSLVQTGERAWRLRFPHARSDCRRASGTCKCALLTAAQPAARVLYIGDGASDFCVAPHADALLAKDRLLAYAQEQRLAHVPIRDFDDAVRFVNERLLDGVAP